MRDRFERRFQAKCPIPIASVGKHTCDALSTRTLPLHRSTQSTFPSPLPNCIPSLHLGILFAATLALYGFWSLSHHQQRYFMKFSRDACRTPILFIHGLGIGPIIYLPFIWLLCQSGRPILVVEMPHVSTRVCFGTPSIDRLVQDIHEILEHHSFERCIVVGHSYGTFVASRLNTLHPHEVKGLCLIDPVCCVMHNPKLLRTFLYEAFDWSTPTALINSAIMHFLSHDPSIAAALCRRFHWMQLNLWPEETPQHTILVLSEGDALVPVDDVKRVFESTPIQMIIHPSHSHGSFVGDLPWQRTIVHHIQHTLSPD